MRFNLSAVYLKEYISFTNNLGLSGEKLYLR